jgi:drug/metabolite transporter (DMT)-like permease
VPLWMALFDRVIFHRRLAARTIVGLVGGFGGAALLVGSSALGNVDLVGMLFALGASICWASGSLYSRTAPLPSRPFVFIAMEMLCGGALLSVVGIAAGELGHLDLGSYSRASVLGLVYLITVGSWGGFASYVWLLRNARTSLVSTYAYVNPVVAVFLGWLILGETVTIRTFVAGGIIVVAVALIISAAGARASDPEERLEGLEDLRPVPEAELALEGSTDPKDRGLAEDLTRHLEADR